MEQDKLANLIGQFGKWQLTICITTSLVTVAAGWVQLAIVFLTPPVTFWCKSFGENGTRIGDNMTCYSNCVEYAYDTTPFDNTIISEWNLVCERAWMASFTQTILQLGVLVGSFLFGLLSDRYGRRISLLVAVVGLIAMSFGIAFSPNYMIFIILRFLLGVMTAGIMVVGFVLSIESVGTNHRDAIGCLFQLPFVIGHMTMTVFAYFYRSWNTFSLALAVPTLIYVMYFFTPIESSRWLISVGKIDHATFIITKAAKMNKQSIMHLDEKIKSICDDIRSKENEVKPHYGYLFEGSLMTKTISSCILWMITGLTYYGLNQYVSHTSLNPFITVGIAGVIELPSLFVSFWLNRKFGRKSVTITFLSLSGICVLISAVIIKNIWINLVLGNVGISCMFIVAVCNYIYTSELFPTVVRNMGLGASSTCMRVGAMIAPFVSNSSGSFPWMPTVIFGLAPLVGALVCLLLPETKGTALPDSIKEIEDKNVIINLIA